MGVLLKVFVVLVTLLSVLLVALIVPFVANTENYKQQLDDAMIAVATAEKTAKQRQAELGRAQDNESELVTRLHNTINNLTTQISQLTQKLADSEAQTQSESAKLAKFEADWSRLTATNEQYAQITKELQGELKQRREQLVNQQTRNIQLADRNNELESQLGALTRQMRRVHENLTHLQEQNADLERKLAQLPPQWQARILSQETAAAPFVPETPIRGRITRVQPLDDETFVEVNVGQNDGVAQNMKFLVHRGSQFLGSLIITQVDAQSSAGRLQLLQGKVVVGDLILTGGYQ